MNPQKRFTPLKHFVLIILTISGTIILGCFLAINLAGYYVSYILNKEAIQTHKTICQNLVEIGRIEEEDCLIPSTYFAEYIPVYFPIGSTAKEIVWQGMMGVTILSNSNTSYERCEVREPGSRLQYRIIFGDSVNFAFCGNQLIAISYSN